MDKQQIIEKMAEIPLGNNKYALIDAEDFELISQYKWLYVSCNKTGYARSNSKKYVLMHRLIMNVQKGQMIDHINRNGIDNRKCNLRVSNYSENARNAEYNIKQKKSKFRGVDTISLYGKPYYRAYYYLDGKKINVGNGRNEIKIAEMYDKAIYEMFKDINLLNFPEALTQTNREG